METRPASSRPAPRVWPVFALLPASLFGALALTGLVVAVVYVARSSADETELMRELAGSALGVGVLIVPSQMVFLAAAVCAALLSPRGLRERLLLRAPRISFATCALLVLGTLAVQGLIQLAAPLLGEPSESVRELARMLTSSTGADAVFVTLLASVLPGLCEELLFRGHAQSRLAERFGPLRAILVSSLFFAAAHVDPQHAAAVFPLGLWLGVIAWISGSTWPAVAAHALNNAFAVLQARGSEDALDFDAPMEPWTIAVFASAAVAGLVGLALARRARTRAHIAPPEPPIAPPLPLADASTSASSPLE